MNQLMSDLSKCLMTEICGNLVVTESGSVGSVWRLSRRVEEVRQAKEEPTDREGEVLLWVYLRHCCFDTD